MPELFDWVMKFHSKGGSIAIFHIYNQESGATSYYQYVNDEGKWYLMRSVKTGAVTVYTFFYGADNDIDVGWTARATPGGDGYQVFNEAFD